MKARINGLVIVVAGAALALLTAPARRRARQTGRDHDVLRGWL